MACEYNKFTHFCYFDRTGQQQPPSTQVLTVHHYASLELLHKNNHSNLAALYKGLKMLFLHTHTHTHSHMHTHTHAHSSSSSSLYCTTKLSFIPIKTQNDLKLKSVISPTEVEHIIYCHTYTVFLSSSICTIFNMLKRQKVKYSMYTP